MYTLKGCLRDGQRGLWKFDGNMIKVLLFLCDNESMLFKIIFERAER